jgi:hypothetical protein
MNTRRQFLIQAPITLLAVAGACREGQKPGTPASGSGTPAPGAPPTFGTAPLAGPPVSQMTFVEAEKLAQVKMAVEHRRQAAGSWQRSMAPYLERRTGPRKVALAEADAPALVWNPLLPGIAPGPSRERFVRSSAIASLPASDDDIAFAPVTQLSRWIESRRLSSTRLTSIYLDRIARLNPKINAIITLTKERALARAAQADRETAAGRYRGPLHGIPYGVKDLLDTAGIATTWGAEPFRTRVPAEDSAVVRRLDDAGAVLVAKLALARSRSTTSGSAARR